MDWSRMFNLAVRMEDGRRMGKSKNKLESTSTSWTDWNPLPLTFVQRCPTELGAFCHSFKHTHLYVFVYLAQKSEEPLEGWRMGERLQTRCYSHQGCASADQQRCVWAENNRGFLLSSAPHTGISAGAALNAAWRKANCGKCISA